MAALTSSAVSLYPSTTLVAGQARESWWYPTTSHHFVEKNLKLVLTGQGGTSNTIGAAALGFGSIIKCSNLWDATNGKSYQAVVDPVNNVILLSAVAADTPADVTTTAAYITVMGSVAAPSAS